MRITTLKLSNWVGITVLLSAAALVTEAEAEERTFWHRTTVLTPTTLVLPDSMSTGTQVPLVIGLHGWGSSAESFKYLGETFAERGVVFAAPESAYPVLFDDGNMGYDWTLSYLGSQEVRARAVEILTTEQIPGLIEYLKSQYPIGPVYLLGFSQGASVAFSVGIRNPALIHGVVSFGLPSLRTERFSQEVLDAGKDLRVMILHGRSDQRTPFRASERARDFLTEAGYSVTFKAFQGGHTVPVDMLTPVLEWIEN